MTKSASITPFGAKVRELRRAQRMTLKSMAAELGLSAAYLSALERGRRGRPPWHVVNRINMLFDLIWDAAEELHRLARISHPRVVVDTSGLSATATEFANRLAERIAEVPEARLVEWLKDLN